MELLELLNSYITESNRYNGYIKVAATPMDIFNKIEDIQKITPQLDAVVSKIEHCIRMVKVESKNLLSQIRQQHTAMMSSISERENMEVPVNTSDILYDENQLMKDIVIGGGFHQETMDTITIRNILVDELVDPKDYSIVAITNRISMFSTIIDVMSGVITREYMNNTNLIKTVKIKLLDLREIINSGDCMDALASQTWDSTNRGFRSRISDAFYKSDIFISLRKDYINLFQVLNAMIDDMIIFQKAVGYYTSIATESFFNANSVYRVL